VQEYAGAGPVVDIRVGSDADVPLQVDGHETGGTYEGRYFVGSRVSVAIPAGARPAFRGWTVNGKPAGSEPTIALRVSAPLEISARFSER
jgi:hypothetical protein